MKKVMLSMVALTLLGGSILSAKDYQVRLGMSSTSGTFNGELANGSTGPDLDMSGTGFEVSFVSNVDKAEGFNFRPVLTLQSNKTALKTVTGSEVDSTDIMFLGEFEFAYNINEYISPFAGFYGGLGSTSVSDWDESGRLTYDLGFLIGASGAIYGDFGYYAKYTVGIKGYNVADDTLGVRQKPRSIKIGVSYTF